MMAPLRAKKGTLVRFAFNANEMFMPTYVGYEYMQKRQSPLQADAAKNFQKMFAEKRAYDARFKKRRK